MLLGSLIHSCCCCTVYVVGEIIIRRVRLSERKVEWESREDILNYDRRLVSGKRFENGTLRAVNCPREPSTTWVRP